LAVAGLEVQGDLERWRRTIQTIGFKPN